MIWLVGNKGMLGSDVEALLREKQMQYIASDREVDIADIKKLREFISGRQIAWIINCAAYTAVDAAEDEPEMAYRLNAQGAGNLAQIAQENEIKLIHISTDYIFDGSKTGEYVESDAPCPVNVYGKSKLRGELNIAATLSSHFIVRTSWLYGKHGNNFVSTMLQLFEERAEIGVVGDQYGSPTATMDVANLLIAIISNPAICYGIYHFSNQGVTSWYDFACEIYRFAQTNGLVSKEVVIKKITTSGYPTRAHRPQNSEMSKQKIKAALGIPIKHWKEALGDYFASYKR